MGTRPSGTITFLFTDVAGSTRLWETDRAGMTASLAVHDRILRESIEAQGGVIFATGGDSFSAAFPTAMQALQAALESQLALEGQDWEGPRITVRMGIHSGAADERDGDYFGPAVTRAARIMAVGHGRQVLVSETTAGLVQDRLEEPMTLSDLGTHPLKDMERPEHLFELRVPGLPAVETPLATSPGGRTHLPEQLTSFVGRSVELATVENLLEDSRAVTLTGVGGTGKTRLAIEAARMTAERFRDGAWMTELAPVTDGSLILSQIADTWSLRPGEGATLIQVVSNYLSTRELLLVVDNCEHVLDSVSELVTRLLTISPGLRILATSRESLGIPGEAVYRVPSMTLPEDDEEAEHSDAVTLFLDRVRKSRPGYTPADGDLSAIIRVCRRLDGIPLGLELAAARLRSLSPAELADRLDDSFRILTGGTKTALPRQRTLQATIDWSHELLDPEERSLFRRASVFVGGFDLAAVEAVLSDSDHEEWEILDLVDQLADKSLLIASLGQHESRFRMLEPIRQYAQERLVDDREAEAVYSAHADYYAGLVSRTEPMLRGPDQKTAHEMLRLDLDNIRAALTQLRDSGRNDVLLQMCFDLGWFWTQASMQEEALEFLLPCLQSEPDVDPSLHARAWWVASGLALGLSDSKSVDYAESGLAVAREAGDEMAVGWTSVAAALAIRGTSDRSDELEYFNTGERLVADNLDRAWWDSEWDRIFLDWARVFVGASPTDEQMDHVAHLISAAKGAGDMFVAAMAMTAAYFNREVDDDPRALAYLEESVRILRGLGFRHGYGHALIYWGWLTRDRRGDEIGESALAKGAEILAEVGDIPCSLDASTKLSGYLMESGRPDDALPHLAFAARQARTAPERFAPHIAAVGCRAAVDAGALDEAALIIGYHTAHTDSSSSLDECRAAVEAGLSAGEVARLTSEGSQMDGAQILELIDSFTLRVHGVV